MTTMVECLCALFGLFVSFLQAISRLIFSNPTAAYIAGFIIAFIAATNVQCARIICEYGWGKRKNRKDNDGVEPISESCYGYDFHNGPHTWNGPILNQSPINISDENIVNFPIRERLTWNHYNDLPLKMTIFNSGHTGVSAEVYYVRDGHVNNYALNFIVPVPANVRDITFTWQSLAGRPLPYSINVVTSDQLVLPRPAMNISQIGEIPTSVQTFAISLKCSNVRAAEVDVTISIEVILNRALNNVTHLVFRRKKICLLTVPVDNSIDDPLLLETIEPPPTGLITLVVGSILALALVLVLFITAYCVRGTSKRQNHGQPMRTSSFQRLNTNAACQSAPAYCTPSSVIGPVHNSTLPRKIDPQQQPEELHRRISELTVERCRVRLSSLLQEGTFGRVYRGTYNDNQDVIVKTVAQHASQMQVSLLLQEGMSLYGASHPGILSVLGVSIEDHTTPFVLYPAPNNTRNLKAFLLEPSCARTITTIQIVMMSSQLAMALGHLHSHGVVHKDIATRNCVIDDQLRVKLSDSSLSRDLFPADYNCLGDSENRPVKWMSLEALQHKQFSEASDSWAFGVLMWELCTFAKQPFAEVDPFEMEHYLKDGYRLAQPFNCPDELFTIMAYCWALLPAERPTFGQLNACLSDFYAQITRYV